MLHPNGKIYRRQVKGALYAPELRGNLLSVRKSNANYFKVLFKENVCVLMRNATGVAIADSFSNLYKLRPEEILYTVKHQNIVFIHGTVNWNIPM